MTRYVSHLVTNNRLQFVIIQILKRTGSDHYSGPARRHSSRGSVRHNGIRNSDLWSLSTELFRYFVNDAVNVSRVDGELFGSCHNAMLEERTYDCWLELLVGGCRICRRRAFRY